MAEPTNTDALHQVNESTEEMQPRRSCLPRLGAGFLMEQRGPLLGSHRASPRGSAKLRFIVATTATVRKVSIRASCCGYPFQGCAHTFRFFFFLFFLPRCMAYGILVSQPGMEPLLPAVETQSLNHWIAREVTFTLQTLNSKSGFSQRNSCV